MQTYVMWFESLISFTRAKHTLQVDVHVMFTNVLFFWTNKYMKKDSQRPFHQSTGNPLQLYDHSNRSRRFHDPDLTHDEKPEDFPRQSLRK